MILYLNKSKSNWQFYISGGFIVEKCILAIYRQEEQRNHGDQPHIITGKRSIDGFQYSLTTALGATYQLDKNFGVYLEPRFGYTFKNNQPISIRTEMPIYMGVNLGLNFSL
jgi:hypothetical protein